MFLKYLSIITLLSKEFLVLFVNCVDPELLKWLHLLWIWMPNNVRVLLKPKLLKIKNKKGIFVHTRKHFLFYLTLWLVYYQKQIKSLSYLWHSKINLHIQTISWIYSLNFVFKISTTINFRELYDSLEFEGLPKVTIATGDSSTLYCTARGCQGQIAVCYCVTCKDKFCSQHQQVK